MRPRLRRQEAVALLLVTSALLVTQANTARADSTVTITTATVSDSAVDVVLSAQGIPAGTVVDPSQLSMTIDGTSVPATAQVSAATGSALPRRTAVLVVDTSGSMAGAPLTDVKAAAQDFLREVPTDVNVGLVSFADRAHLLVAPTRDRAALRSQLLTLKAGGATALYDAVSLAISQVGPTGERLVCVLSDGADTSSRASLAELTNSLRRARVATEIVSYQTDAGQTRTLSHLAAQVGGRLIPATDAKSLVGAFGAAAGTFGTQIHVTATLGAPLAAGDHSVAVAMTVAGHTVTDSTTVAVATAVPTSSPASPAPAPSSPVGTSMTGLSLWALLVLVFVALTALFGSVLAPRGGRARASLHALDAYRLDAAGQPSGATAGADAGEQPKGVAQTALSVSERYVQRRGTGERLALRLEQADLRIRPNEFVLLEFCVGVALVVAVTLLTNRLLVGIPAGFLLTVLAAHLLLSHRAKRRAAAFEDQLPDTLHLVSSSIRTGFSLGQALDGASEGASNPMAAELNRAIAETRLGGVLEDSLDRVADRMGSNDLRWTVMAVRIQQRVGGNLSEVLETTAATIRERASMRRKVVALSAEGRLSAYILIGLPILLFGFLYLVRRPYISLLWTTTPGLVLSVIGVVLMVVGWFWMRSLSKVEI